MLKVMNSRRQFLKAAASTAALLRTSSDAAQVRQTDQASSENGESSRPDYTLRIGASPVEIAPKRIISTVTYNGQFPGPLLRFKEGQQVTVDVFNDTDAPEQLHWHGQIVPTNIDGAAEEGTPFVPAHSKRRLVFTPRPAGFRF